MEISLTTAAAAAAAIVSIAMLHAQAYRAQPGPVCQRASTQFGPPVWELQPQGIHANPRDVSVNGGAMGFRGATVSESVNGTIRGRTQSLAQTLRDERFRSGGFPTTVGSRPPLTFAPKYMSVGQTRSLSKKAGVPPGGGSSDGGSDGKDDDKFDVVRDLVIDPIFVFVCSFIGHSLGQRLGIWLFGDSEDENLEEEEEQEPEDGEEWD